MFVDDYPDATLEEILAHHGVKGMHWGVRRSQVKATGSDIRDARARLAVKSNEYRKAKKEARKTKDPHAKTLAKTKVAHLKQDFLNNPDRITAVRTTAGEKAALALLGSGSAIASRALISRHIEKKQANGGYKYKPPKK